MDQDRDLGHGQRSFSLEAGIIGSGLFTAGGQVGMFSTLAAEAPSAGGVLAGAGLMGFGLGTLGAAAIDTYGGRYHDENGIEMSAFDKAADLGRSAQAGINGLVGAEDSTMALIAGAATSGALSIPLAIGSALGGWDW